MAKKKKIKIASPVKSLRGLELRYQKELNKVGKALIQTIRKEVLFYLKANESTYVIDGYTKDGIGDQLNRIFLMVNQQFSGVAMASFSQFAAEQVVNKVARTNKRKFDKTVHRATGVDLGSIVTAEGLEDFTSLSISKNVSLIKSLPEEYLKQIETIVNNGVVSGARYKTIERQITAKVGGANKKLANRIKTIARNEVQTINSQITLRRSEALGIKRGIYRTSEDERVRTCHEELNDVEYDLSKGAWSKTCRKFIQPGITDINCRCSYSPIIEVD